VRLQGQVERCDLIRTLLEKQILVPVYISNLSKIVVSVTYLLHLAVETWLVKITICSRFGICNRWKLATRVGWHSDKEEAAHPAFHSDQLRRLRLVWDSFITHIYSYLKN